MKTIELLNFRHKVYTNSLVNSTKSSVKLVNNKINKGNFDPIFNIWGAVLSTNTNSSSTLVDNKNLSRFISYDENSSKSLLSRFKSLKDGLESGYFIELVLKGIGFKVFQFEKTLFLQLGFSHFYVYNNKNEDILIKAKRDRILIFGFNKQLVGNIAYEISSLRTPDSYKAKGIQFKDKTYILKEGKKK